MSRADESPEDCIRRLEDDAISRCRAAAKRARVRVHSELDAHLPHNALGEWVRTRPRASVLLAAGAGFLLSSPRFLRKARAGLHTGPLLAALATTGRSLLFAQLRDVLRRNGAQDDSKGDPSARTSL